MRPPEQGMEIDVAETTDLDLEALEKKYAEERAKRLRTRTRASNMPS